MGQVAALHNLTCAVIVHCDDCGGCDGDDTVRDWDGVCSSGSEVEGVVKPAAA